jgi:uncharacterized membrane-anchored protein YitT (DUF2179 family)
VTACGRDCELGPSPDSSRGISAGKIQMLVDVLVVRAAFFVVPPVRVLQSVVDAVAIGAILTLNHRPGRYLGV